MLGVGTGCILKIFYLVKVSKLGPLIDWSSVSEEAFSGFSDNSFFWSSRQLVHPPVHLNHPVSSFPVKG
jgi:hypothetical protein